MKTLLVKFEKNSVNYIFIENLADVLIADIIIENISFSEDLNWEKFVKILEELNLIQSKYSVECIIFQSAIKTQRWLDEVRFANEAFLRYFCFKNSIKILEINKIIARQNIEIPQKDFIMEFEKNKQLLIEKWIKKTNPMLDLLTFIFILSKYEFTY